VGKKISLVLPPEKREGGGDSLRHWWGLGGGGGGGRKEGESSFLSQKGREETSLPGTSVGGRGKELPELFREERTKIFHSCVQERGRGGGKNPPLLAGKKTKKRFLLSSYSAP